jgi:phosphopantetheinyl transferase (holo-ACP synthase)
VLSERDLSDLRAQERWSSWLAYPVYAFLLWALNWHYRYHFQSLEEFQREVWKELDAHDGPVIWAANHLTLIDSFLIFRAVFPFAKANKVKRVPWSTPEYRNYYHLGGWLQQRAIRLLMYLCRCIPFLREGDDEKSVSWRETAFQKLVWILNHGGTAFVYPEAGRARSGWFEKRRPKDFLGRLAMEVPKAKFLCVYLRGEEQHYTTAVPQKNERIRAVFSLVDGARPGETNPRDISQRLFDEIGRLQDEWWKRSTLRRNCGGNDVVDLKHPLLQENIDPASGDADMEWLSRHLTKKERAYWDAQEPAKRFAAFWKFFAAKEAAFKAFAQAGIGTPNGGYLHLEADLFRRKVRHLTTGAECDLAFTDDDADKLHCVTIMRGGWIGDDQNQGDVLWKVAEVPKGESPSAFARELLLSFIAESSDDISPAALALSEESGQPKVLRRGKVQDWGASISHSGRYAACSFMIS